MKNKQLLYGILIVAALVILGIGLFTYLNKPPLPARTIEQVQEQYAAELMSIEGVVGVGIGECDGTPCIQVYLEKEFPSSAMIPEEIEGYKIQKVISGPIKAL